MNAAQRRSDKKRNLSIDNAMKCLMCDKTFTNVKHLKYHVQGHEKVTCHFCYESVPKSLMCYHMILHSGSEKLYKCQICSKTFGQKANLARHRTVHTGERPYKCDICSKGFTQKSNLYSHKTVHNGEKPFKCDICAKGFTQKSTLMFHKTIHTGVKPFKCDVCAKGFTRRCLLATHSALHVDGKIFESDICPSRLPPKPISRNQKVIETGGKPFKCDICLKGFIDKFTLDIHKTAHTGVKLFKCNICLNKYFNLHEIKIHMIKHNGMTPHKCTECPKEFLNAKLLKQHKIVHFQKFQCPICSKLFARLINIIEHMKKCKSSDVMANENGATPTDTNIQICLEPNGNGSTKDNNKFYFEPNIEIKQEDKNAIDSSSTPSSMAGEQITYYNNNEVKMNTTTNVDRLEGMMENCNFDSESQQPFYGNQDDTSQLHNELLQMNPELDLIYNYIQPNTIKQELDIDKSESDTATIRFDFEHQNYELHSILDIIKSEPQ